MEEVLTAGWFEGERERECARLGLADVPLGRARPEMIRTGNTGRFKVTEVD